MCTLVQLIVKKAHHWWIANTRKFQTEKIPTTLAQENIFMCVHIYQMVEELRVQKYVTFNLLLRM